MGFYERTAHTRRPSKFSILNCLPGKKYTMEVYRNSSIHSQSTEISIARMLIRTAAMSVKDGKGKRGLRGESITKPVPQNSLGSRGRRRKNIYRGTNGQRQSHQP